MRDKYSKLTMKVFILSLLLVFMYGCDYNTKESKMKKLKKDTIQQEKTQFSDGIAVGPPPFSKGIFPCSQCHKTHIPNLERRKLMFHGNIDSIFNHDSENRWCLDCHYAEDRDFLKLASGKLIPFSESYKLCGQCHGDKYRDWKVGVHGKRTGNWNGKKQYLLCVSCHNPHTPRFKQIKPMPAPMEQKDIY